MQSPLFPVIAPSLGVASALRVVSDKSIGTSAGPTLSTRRITLDPADAISVSDIMAAENKLFSLADETDIDLAEKDHHFIDHPGSLLLVRMNQTSSLIATRTRRGGGNNVFMHPIPFALIDGRGLIYQKLGKVGRWQQYNGQGPGMGRFTYNVSEDLSADEIYVAYVNGSILGDGPAVLAHDVGAFALLALKAGPTMLAQTSDYIRKLNITSYPSWRDLLPSFQYVDVNLVDMPSK